MVLTNYDSTFSKKDIKRGIKIPSTDHKLLAEFVGALIGDGNLNNYKRPGSVSYRTLLSGHAKDDLTYYFYHIQLLFKRLFSTKFTSLFLKKNELRLHIYSKAIFHFLQDLELQVGNKNEAKGFPPIIFSSNKKTKANFLRGVFDTDGTMTFKAKYKNILHKYPVVSITFQNYNFMKDLVTLLKEFPISFYVNYMSKVYDPRTNKEYIKNSIYISGVKNLKKWMKFIGSKNPKHLTKLAIWEEYGFCPPKTTLRQREQIIYGQLDPYDFYPLKVTKF